MSDEYTYDEETQEVKKVSKKPESINGRIEGYKSASVMGKGPIGKEILTSVLKSHYAQQELDSPTNNKSRIDNNKYNSKAVMNLDQNLTDIVGESKEDESEEENSEDDYKKNKKSKPASYTEDTNYA